MKKISIKNLDVIIKKNQSQIYKIKDQSFDILPGDVILLSGPNGAGKSSIIKILTGDIKSFDSKDLKYNGQLIYEGDDETFNIDDNEDTYYKFSKKVCYVSQKDDTPFSLVLDSYLSSIANIKEITNPLEYVLKYVLDLKIYNIYYSNEAPKRISFTAKSLLKKLHISNPSDEEIKAVSFLTRRKENMSGGELKMLNITSNLIRFPYVDICFLDEPLNNLDYSNVRLFSNMLVDIYKEKPELAFLIVTHCRSLTIINKMLEIDPKTYSIKCIDSRKYEESYLCNSCFGAIDKEGYYID